MIELLFALACSNVSVGASLPSPFVQAVLKDYSNYTLVIYGIDEGIPCIKLRTFLSDLSELYGFKVVWVSVSKGVPKNATAVSVAEDFGLPYVPITGVYCGRKLVAVVVGDVENSTFWLEEVMKCTNVTRVYEGQKLLGTWRPSARALNGPVLILALVDSLNPVGLMVFTFYILACKNVKKRCSWDALAFVVAYTFTHVALGVALSLVPASPYYPVIGAIVSLMVIVSSIKPNKKIRSLTAWASSTLNSLVLKRASPAVLGLLAGSVGTSPCVLGAFLSAASLIGNNLIMWGAYAMIYAAAPTVIFIIVNRGKVVDPRKVVLPLATISLLISVYLAAVNLGFVSFTLTLR
ncbi:hypothetical protein [Ignicoccus hospitalis]|uniref:Uncharacterized protein n=1 Tax=Ignicoccus hospitalis (strain KIN4/I / DSM 18386 / JCM 14125) TaxID=453591 RepID=A8ACE5_IGNH4|nr:hypothetical protein [Ignicoccus hospitalis]ABU82597.1 hypothetical protein Igni_1421 [Ignicoccus hospitalis KIN4/I]HIH90762.1 hypothetical protein [Desulfurococcaceae archaeon]